MRPLVVDGLVVLAAVCAWRAIRHTARAPRHPDDGDSSIRLVRGIRALVFAATSVAFALGIIYESRAMLLIAAVILGEELYETGVVLLVLRRQRRRGWPEPLAARMAGDRWSARSMRRQGRP